MRRGVRRSLLHEHWYFRVTYSSGTDAIMNPNRFTFSTLVPKLKPKPKKNSGAQEGSYQPNRLKVCRNNTSLSVYYLRREFIGLLRQPPSTIARLKSRTKITGILAQGKKTVWWNSACPTGGVTWGVIGIFSCSCFTSNKQGSKHQWIGRPDGESAAGAMLHKVRFCNKPVGSCIQKYSWEWGR